MKNLLTFCLMVCCVAVQAQLVTYPEGLQTGMSHNDDYTVRVRVPGGDWKDLFEYNVQGKHSINSPFHSKNVILLL